VNKPVFQPGVKKDAGATRGLGLFPAIGYAFAMQAPSDEQLMHRYARGDMSAFESLYDRYRGPLYRYIQRQVRNPATANDLYQGSWEKLIKARKRYRPAAPFRAWLFRIAHNHLVDHFRANRITEQLDHEQLPAAGGQPIDILDTAQRERRFRVALQDLPEAQKNTLLLKVEAGLGLEEIGKITGVERETVKSRLRYATAKLKRALIT
jgi:RNA polymerase sigma-70 factor (ECF subfamily)